MAYYIDLEKISIDDYKSILKTTNFLPSWELLKDNIDKNLGIIQKTGIHKKEILTLTKLTDLSRVKWVNHTFANVLLLAGYDTAEKVASANAEELFEAVKKLNEEKNLFPTHIGLNDMKRVIASAMTLSFDIQYD